LLYFILINLLAFLSISLFIQSKKSFLIKNFYRDKEKHNYNKNILPLGGLILISLIFLNYKILNLEFLITCFLIFLMGFSSDLKIIKSPKFRFILMIFVVGIYIFYSNIFISQNNFPIIYKLLNNELFNFIFLLVSTLIIINGCNFIDGVNNNLNIYFFLLNLSVIYIKYTYGIDFELNILLGIFSIFFFYFNYKNILMFGDGGAYLIGFLSALELVNITNEIQTLSKYYAIILLAYPSYEVLFSIIRKRKKNALFPDEKHLHLLLIKHNNKNHIKTSLQLNFLNFIIFLFGSIYHYDDLILVFLILLYLIAYNFFHNYLSRQLF
jgi:UDP-N-acetylmuramyl pentapeptide phosphotransferase/UDP-N-acetylglucosamine-1-phosphate transferase